MLFPHLGEEPGRLRERARKLAFPGCKVKKDRLGEAAETSPTRLQAGNEVLEGPLGRAASDDEDRHRGDL